MEDLNSRYVEISKAYQALTDEEVRNNYIQYGHPDGRQGYSIAIALPKAMVTGGNGKYVILVYFLLFGVLLPYLVGSWWYGIQRRSKEGVLMESANRLFRQYEDTIDESGILHALSTAKEFEEAFRGDQADAGLSKVESRILDPGDASPLAASFSAKDREKLRDLESGPRRKALALLWAYLGRVELDDDALTKAQFEVGPIAYPLTKSFTAISLAYGNTVPILASYYTSQLLIQAIPPKASPLLQLPYFTPAIVRAVEGEDSRTRMSVQAFMDQPDARRRRLAVGPNLLSEDQYQTAVAVAKQLPYFRVAKAFFKVAGERFIIPSSLVTLVVKGRFVPPGSENVPAVDELDLEDVDPAEDDLDAILGRKTKRQIGKDENGRPILASESKEPVVPPLAFAPYFARDHSPRWNVFLTDSKQGKMAVPPFTFTQFDRPIFEADGKTPTYAMQTLKAQFQAPPQAGHYTFVMHVVCDSYVGFDTKMEVTLVVDDASKAAQMADEDQISEPDEDSLQGIMNAAKGGAPLKKKKRDEEDSDEDESATESEADDTSDTNTDTEPEN
ncbi:hypothetical protein VTK73DRAFT_1851 [Phialemonium thermophilum]|uniref:SEC63 domain-containing protein n=1 Tax=Phialemonium thermophilum TaxID=223376 RepID=A0ABR3VSX0_9PEZI